MALYFFHLQTDTSATDAEGIESATPLEALAQAIVTCGQMVKDSAETFRGSRPWSVIVTDAQGLILWEVSMDGFASPAARDFEALSSFWLSLVLSCHDHLHTVASVNERRAKMDQSSARAPIPEQAERPGSHI